MGKKIKIGLPRALFFYDYYPFCKCFFEGLGAEIVVSEKTNKALLQGGLKHSINELCIPIKLLYAHVIDLKDKVDYIFLPHVITLDKETFMCPKLIAAPDIIRNSMDDVNLLSAEIDTNNFYSSLYESAKEIFLKINSNPVKIYSEYTNALRKQELFDKFREEGLLFEEALAKLENKKCKLQKEQKKKIAVIGHPYIINDDYINSDLIKKLNSFGAKVLTSDMVKKEDIENELKRVEKIPHWTFAKKVLGSAIHYSKDNLIDGIIYVTPFGCSPDSLMKDTMISSLQNKKPLLTLTIDEHTGEAGIVTRIEAFLDMIERRK
jgi:predicted nucleotide-binding protein (sugar kinase/HSP70/actin superfamily)